MSGEASPRFGARWIAQAGSDLVFQHFLQLTRPVRSRQNVEIRDLTPTSRPPVDRHDKPVRADDQRRPDDIAARLSVASVP